MSLLLSILTGCVLLINPLIAFHMCWHTKKIQICLSAPWQQRKQNHKIKNYNLYSNKTWYSTLAFILMCYPIRHAILRQFVKTTKKAQLQQNSPVKGQALVFTVWYQATLTSIANAVIWLLGRAIFWTDLTFFTVVNPFVYIFCHGTPVEKSWHLFASHLPILVALLIVVLFEHTLHFFRAA